MGSWRVRRTALVFPDAAGNVSSSLTSSSSHAAAGDDGGTLAIEVPPEGSERPLRRFAFDRVEWNTDGGRPSLSWLMEEAAEAGRAGPPQSTFGVLFHGAVSPLVMRNLFMEAVGRLTRCVLEDAETVTASFSVLRVYSWGATDVLRSTIVERNVVSPSRPPPPTTERSTATPGGSEYIGDHSSDTVMYRRLPPEGFDERGWPLLKQVLLNALRVPDGHAAVRFSLVKHCKRDGHVCSYTMGLLPQLERANHLLRDDLLHLRHAVQARVSDLDRHVGDVGRLAGMLLSAPPDAANALHVVTAVDGAVPHREAGLLQCWYGCHPASQPTPVWSRSPSSGLRTVGGGEGGSEGSEGGSEGRPLCRSSDLSFSTPKCLFPSHSEALPPLPPPVRICGDAQQGQCLGSLRSEPPPPPSSSLSLREPPEGSRTDREADGDPPAGVHRTPPDTDVVSRLRLERAVLERNKAELQGEIASLEAYKSTLEKSIGAFFLSVGEDVLKELEEAESAMLSEVHRAQTILGVSQASGLAQEEQLLSRLSLLVSELPGNATLARCDRTPLRPQ